MGLAAYAVLLAAIGALPAWVIAFVLTRQDRRPFATLSPARRARWLFGLLAAPPVTGLALVLLALSPCLRTLVLGLPDDCRGHGGPRFCLCLFDPPGMSWSFGVIAVLLGAPLLVRGAGLAASLISAQRLVRELGGLATFDASKAAYLIPGTSCFVAGWPRGAIYLGRDLLRGLDEGGLTSVLAHERAHLRYGHVAWRVAARVLAAFHLPGVGRRLLSALDLALEQVCDQRPPRGRSVTRCSSRRRSSTLPAFGRRPRREGRWRSCRAISSRSAFGRFARRPGRRRAPR